MQTGIENVEMQLKGMCTCEAPEGIGTLSRECCFCVCLSLCMHVRIRLCVCVHVFVCMLACIYDCVHVC